VAEHILPDGDIVEGETLRIQINHESGLLLYHCGIQAIIFKAIPHEEAMEIQCISPNNS
jgi:hypothetical protein